jgi:hypothetical protein
LSELATSTTGSAIGPTATTGANHEKADSADV